MFKKLKSISISLKEKKYFSKAAVVVTYSKQIFEKILDKTNKLVAHLAKYLYQIGLTANMVSIVGFIIGLLAINFLAMSNFFAALICILVNRFCDALDGALARHAKVTDFGIFLDATLDYVFYAGLIFGFALANPSENAVSAAFLLFAFTSSACAMLAYAIVAYKNKAKNKIEIAKSPFYLGGFAQGFETFIAMIILCLIPSGFLFISIVLGIFCFVKACSVVIAAYYNFVIAQRLVKDE